MIINTISLVEHFLKTKLPESNEIFFNLINKSGKCIAKLKIWNYNKHLRLLKIFIIDNSIISSEQLNSVRLHVNNLNLLQCFLFICLCNDDCKGKLDTAGLKHFFFFFEINHARSSIDSGNQKNVANEIRIKNTSWQ